MRYRRLIWGLALVAAAVSAFGADWPQYRGPASDGSSPERGILKKWPTEGPRQVWKKPLQLGFSSFAIAGGKAYTLEQRYIEGASQEVCLALDANTGKEFWAFPIGMARYDNGYDAGPDDGPRSTPAVSGGKVYVNSALLRLVCLNADSGKVVWSKDLTKENGAKNISWQNAASPLIDGNLLFVAGGGPGQALLGIDKENGKVLWKGENDRMTHASPIAATILGKRQIIFFTQSGLVAVQPEDGKLLWRYTFPYRTSTAASPVVAGDIVYCSAAYGVGAGAARVTKDGDQWKATELWRKPGNALCNHWSTPVARDGYIYGLFGSKQFKTGPLKCIEAATGKEVWSQPGFGPGNLITFDGQLLVLTDYGDLVLAEASASGYTELTRTHAVDGKSWSSPAISNGHIFARSSKEGVCLDVSAQTVSR